MRTRPDTPGGVSTPRVHRNLAWLVGDPAAIDLLARDKELAKLVVAVVAPGLLAVVPGNVEKVAKRLEKLGSPARRVRGMYR